MDDDRKAPTGARLGLVAAAFLALALGAAWARPGTPSSTAGFAWGTLSPPFGR
jgi:hypothetical protein